MFKQVLLLLMIFFSISQHIFSTSQQTRDDHKEGEKEKCISLCDIENNPTEYVGKQFDVQATYVVGFEMSWLESAEPCKSQGGKRYAIRYVFNYEKNTDRSILRRVAKEFDRPIKKPTYVHKIRGQFRILVSKYEKRNDYDTQYEYELIILKII